MTRAEATLSARLVLAAADAHRAAQGAEEERSIPPPTLVAKLVKRLLLIMQQSANGVRCKVPEELLTGASDA